MAPIMYQLLGVLFLAVAVLSDSPFCYDHQSDTYTPQFEVTECNKECTVTPFFSPDHSIDTYVELIQSAKESIDLYTPGFNSWSKCTNFSNSCNTCMGCSIEDQKDEEFPVFAALLNAVHKGVKVRIVTNNFTQTSCEGLISPLAWLYLNGIQIKWYTSTTFMHSKVVIVDRGRRTSISSVNFSFTSFMKNREAGVVIEDCTCPLLDMYGQLFQYDWENGDTFQVYATYSREDMSIITDPSPMKVELPKQPVIDGAYVTKKVPYSNVPVTMGYTSPDGARDQILSDLSGIKYSLQVAIYQITDDEICSKLLDLHNAGVNVSVIVSARIVSYIDYKQNLECCSKLYSGGMDGLVRKSYSKFTYSHQKYWIMDGEKVHLSTGNWSPSDFPPGTSFAPRSSSNLAVNRDLVVAMDGTDMVKAFGKVFSEDWAVATPWKPN